MAKTRDDADDSWKPYKCAICGKHFLYSMNHKRHASVHKECLDCKELNPMPVKCPHVKFNCDYCDRTFATQSEYKKCQAQHKKKPECRYCKKTFKQLYSLKIHMNIHTGRRPYVCEVCGYSCHSPQVLRHHELFNHVQTVSQA
ncbi:hypothetical protein ACHWQZ_G008206 [Mnemiopsis leidyi]